MIIKKKVSFVNPNFQQGPREFNAYYLPYSPGIIWSYAYQFDEIKEKYELGEFIWRRDPIEEVVELLKDVNGKVTGAVLKDELSQVSYSIKAKSTC
jgi:hypothetical protein